MIIWSNNYQIINTWFADGGGAAAARGGGGGRGNREKSGIPLFSLNFREKSGIPFFSLKFRENI